jgi:hypothetical protein
MVRGSIPSTHFDLRFTDTDTNDPEDHPWRMVFSIDNRTADWDGTWQQIDIPLASFWEQGAWEDEWFNPQGDFDWSHVQSFTLSAPDAMTDTEVCFDNIRIVGESETAVHTDAGQLDTFELMPVCPNPFNGMASIKYRLPAVQKVRIRLLDVRGREAGILLDERQPAGAHTYRLDSQGLASGLYIVDVRAGKRMLRQKIMVLK